MKKNRLMRIAALLLVLTLATSCFVGGTFAKYTSTATGSDTATVAKWDIQLKAGTADVHGAPLGEEGCREAKINLGLPEDQQFYVVPEAYKYFEEKRNANAQVNSSNDVVKPANDVVEPTNAQPRAQENIPQEMVAPKNRVTVDPESEMEYISEEDYDGAQTNGNFGKNTVGSAQLNNTFYKSLDEFGAQRLRKEQIANGNEMRVPKKISENEAITENVGYMLGSKLADNDYMDDVIQHPEKYAHIINTDANSMQNAIDYIQNNGLDETYGAYQTKYSGWLTMGEQPWKECMIDICHLRDVVFVTEE